MAGGAGIIHKNEQTKGLKKSESKMKEEKAKKKSDEKYWNAINKSALTADDMKSMLMQCKQPGYSPLQTKVAPLSLPFAARLDCLQPFLNAME